MHAGAVGALQVIKVDHGDLCVRIAADRTSLHIDGRRWILRQIESLEARQRLAVG